MIDLQKNIDLQALQFKSDLDMSRKNNDALTKSIKSIEQRNQIMFRDNKEFKEKNEQLHREV